VRRPRDIRSSGNEARRHLPRLRVTNYRRRAAIAFSIDEVTATVAILGVYYGGRNYESELGADQDE